MWLQNWRTSRKCAFTWLVRTLKVSVIVTMRMRHHSFWQLSMVVKNLSLLSLISAAPITASAKSTNMAEGASMAALSFTVLSMKSTLIWHVK
ncbi:hypothetical protein CsSME_00041837 [Camellia sinensis var. sinensis]